MADSSARGKAAYKQERDTMDLEHEIKRRSGDSIQHIRRSPQGVVDQASQVGGGLASGRGDGVGGQDTASTPAATDGLASNRGDHQDTALAGDSSSGNNATPTSSANSGGQNNNNNNGGGQASATSTPWMDNNNNNNGGNQGGYSDNNQWAQPTSSQQQQHQDQWQQQPSSSSSQNNWNSWDNHNNADNGNTWQNTQDQNTWQQMSSSNSWDQAAASQTSSSAATDAGSSSDTETSTPSSAIPSASSGIIDTSNAVDQDGVASEASTTGSKSSKLGAGGTAGIVIAVLAVLALAAAVFVYRRRKRAQNAAEREYGNTGFMSERFSTGSNFYQAPNASTTSGGFITFHDNASTYSGLHNAASVGSIIHHSPTLTAAPPAMPNSLQPRQEQPDDDDASHYDHETVDEHGDLGRPSSAYYGTQPSPYDGVHSHRMPEYNLPTPPIPAFDSEEAIMSSRSVSNNMAYIAGSRTALRRGPDERRAMNRSISPQNSYVDEQLRDLYVGQY